MMKTSLLILSILILSNCSTIYIVVEEPPEYPGGLLALRRYIFENINFPEIDEKDEINTTAHFRFVITKSGKIGKIIVERNFHPKLDGEVIRLLKSLPKFKPAKHNGKNVNIWFSLPLHITLN